MSRNLRVVVSIQRDTRGQPEWVGLFEGDARFIDDEDRSKRGTRNGFEPTLEPISVRGMASGRDRSPTLTASDWSSRSRSILCPATGSTGQVVSGACGAPTATVAAGTWFPARSRSRATGWGDPFVTVMRTTSPKAMLPERKCSRISQGDDGPSARLRPTRQSLCAHAVVRDHGWAIATQPANRSLATTGGLPTLVDPPTGVLGGNGLVHPVENLKPCMIRFSCRPTAAGR